MGHTAFFLAPAINIFIRLIRSLSQSKTKRKLTCAPHDRNDDHGVSDGVRYSCFAAKTGNGDKNRAYFSKRRYIRSFISLYRMTVSLQLQLKVSITNQAD